MVQIRVPRLTLLVVSSYAVEPTRATWTDERLDDLARRVDDGFDRVDRELQQTRAELGHTRAELGGRIDALGGRIDGLQRTLLQIGGAAGLGFVATLLSVIATRG